jgi:hypothetical protein
MRLMRMVLALACILSMAGVAFAAKEHGATKHYEDSILKMTDKGTFSVEMLLHGHALTMGLNEFDIIIHDAKDRDVPGARLTITPWMPGMGHGVLEKPEVTDRGGGLYNVKNVMISMGGHWEVRVRVEAGGETDSAVFNFPDIQAGGKKMPVGSAETSGTKKTDGGTFEVTYESKRDDIPVGKIHSWVLTVKDAGGAPVNGASITIRGGMPAHGHGLPTIPEVTEELGGGRYLVEGMKFSMPGHWVLTITMEHGGKKDSVTFAIML